MQQTPRLGLVFGLHLVWSSRNPVEEAGDGSKRDPGQRHWLDQALPDVDEGADARVVRQARIERRLVGVVQNVHDMRAAHARRIVELRGEVRETTLAPGYFIRGHEPRDSGRPIATFTVRFAAPRPQEIEADVTAPAPPET